jgi:hypothetical protein
MIIFFKWNIGGFIYFECITNVAEMQEDMRNMSKNECNKTRTKENPYEIWKNNAGWTWYVLRKYQNKENEEKNPYARWFCLVKSPFVPDGELGDVYCKDIKNSAELVEKNY